MKKITRLFGSLLILLMMVAACSKDSYEPNTTPSGGKETPTPSGPTISSEIQQADQFAQGVLASYYLWKDEIASAIESELDPETCTDPIATVEKIRYKEGGGYKSNQDEDRWTQLFEDITPFEESVQGVATTNGLNLSVGSFTVQLLRQV